MVKTFIQQHWKWLAPLAAVVIGVGIWLVFFVFAFQTYFIDDEVSEDVPVFASGAGATTSPSGLPGDEISADLDAEMDQAMVDDNIPAEQPVNEVPPMDVQQDQLDDMMTDAGDGSGEEPVDGSDGGSGDVSDGGSGDGSDDGSADGSGDGSDGGQPAAPEITIAVQGEFINRSHPTSGQAVVLTDGIQRFLRFEDFRTDNGPDLNVYLSAAAPDAPASQFDDDFIDLGDLKGNIGPQNYELTDDIDLDRYSTVVIWCVRFSVAFGAAELA